jgi:phosphoribosylanthranilate isomerase
MIVRIKVCGITSVTDALAAVEAGADALGFMFYEQSARFVSPSLAAEIIRHLPPQVTRVGVFVGAAEAEVRRAAEACGLDTLQFHGDESPAFCARFAVGESPEVLRTEVRVPAAATPSGYRVIRAFRILNADSLAALPAYRCGAWLLDSYVPGQRGGTGAKFNWELAVQAKQAGAPVILAGGLTPDNVAAAVRQVRPYGVDVSSGVESAPGRKDPARLRAFVRAARGA